MKKRMTIMIIALIIVFGGIIGFHLIKSFMITRFFASYEAPPVSVSSVTAIKKTWKPRINAVGNFVAIKGVDVNSQASGKVVKINFESGQYVKENKPLIDIDDSIDQANLRFNQADMALKQINYQRQQDLLKRGATSTSSLDEAKANLNQAQANVDKIQAEINQKHIVAPFAGKLGIRQVNLGQYISPGQTAIVSLQSLDPLFLEFYLPEQQLKLLYVDQPIKFHVEEFPNALFEGKVTAINSKIDTNTHNILVQATLQNCPALAVKNPEKSNLISIRQVESVDKKIVTCHTDLNTQNKVNQFVFIPGMFASISIELASIPDVVVLPSTAISYSLYGNSVFIIEPTKERKKDANGNEIYQVKRVFINSGEQEGNDTVIESGVKAGELIVSSGELKLQNGAHVIINNSVNLNKTSNPKTLGQ